MLYWKWNYGYSSCNGSLQGIDPSEVVITDVVTEKGQKLADELGCNFVETNGEAIKAAHYVVFCVKPQFLKSVLEEVNRSLRHVQKKGRKNYRFDCSGCCGFNL